MPQTNRSRKLKGQGWRGHLHTEATNNMRAHGGKLAFYWVPIFLWMLGIFLLSSTTSSTLGQVKESNEILPMFVSKIITSQYLVHPVEFGMLSVLVYRLLVSYQSLSTRFAVSVALGWAIGYGVLDEVHQSFVAGRASTLTDVGLDSAGAIIALSLVLILAPRIRSFTFR